MFRHLIVFSLCGVLGYHVPARESQSAPPDQPQAENPPVEQAPQVPARPDPHVWAARNVDLIRQAIESDEEPLASGGVITALSFSLWANPLLGRDPYAGQVLEALEQALAKPKPGPRGMDPPETEGDGGRGARAAPAGGRAHRAAGVCEGPGRR